MRLRFRPTVLLDLADLWIDSWRPHRFGIDHVHRARAMTPHRGFLVLFWHQTTLMVAGTHRDLRATAMVSRSGDGTMLAEFLRRRGITAARGSKSRGGAAASLNLLHRMRAGLVGASSIDGPRGPFKQPQAGIIDLARRAGVPIVPVACRGSREVAVRAAWDRVRIPLPRAHVAICYGAPILLPPEEPDAADHAARRHHLAAVLHGLEREAADRTGQPFRDPVAADIAWMDAR